MNVETMIKMANRSRQCMAAVSFLIALNWAAFGESDNAGRTNSFNEEIPVAVQRAAKAVVAIGLPEYDENGQAMGKESSALGGSGVLISRDGLVLTADHITGQWTPVPPPNNDPNAPEIIIVYNSEGERVRGYMVPAGADFPLFDKNGRPVISGTLDPREIRNLHLVREGYKYHSNEEGKPPVLLSWGSNKSGTLKLVRGDHMIIHAYDGHGRLDRDALIRGNDDPRDLAVLKVLDSLPNDIRPLKVRDLESKPLKPYEPVFAIGYGKVGDIRAGHFIEMGQNPDNRNDTIPYIVSSVILDPGYSGGALVDRHGRLLGINVAMPRAAEAVMGLVALSIPVSPFMSHIEDLENGCPPTYGDVGIAFRMSDYSREIKRLQALGYPGNAGALVLEVNPHGPAAGNLYPGDVICTINKQPVFDATAFDPVSNGLTNNVPFEIFRVGTNQQGQVFGRSMRVIVPVTLMARQQTTNGDSDVSVPFPASSRFGRAR